MRLWLHRCLFDMLKVFLATLISYGHQLATIKHSSSINLLIIVWTKWTEDWLPSYIIIVLFVFITWPLSLPRCVFFSSSCHNARQILCLHSLLVQIFSKYQNKTSSTTIRVNPVQLVYAWLENGYLVFIVRLSMLYMLLNYSFGSVLSFIVWKFLRAW